MQTQTARANIFSDKLIQVIDEKKIERNIHQGYYRHTCVDTCIGTYIGMIDEPCHDYNSNTICNFFHSQIVKTQYL